MQGKVKEINNFEDCPSVSNHAALQYLNKIKGRLKLDNNLMKVAMFGKEIYPTETFMKKLKYKEEIGRFFTNGSYVVVVAGNNIVTCYPYDKYNRERFIDDDSQPKF